MATSSSASTVTTVSANASLTLSGAQNIREQQAPQRSSQDENDEEESIYDEIEIEDMTYDPTLQIYHFPCPCGDRFEISIADMRDGQDVAVCPSCSLMIRVIFEQDDLAKEDGKEK